MDSFRGAGSSRLMDYLRVGLGVIISPGLKFQWFLARRYSVVVVPVTREFLKDPRPSLESAMREISQPKKRNLAAITTRGAAPRLGKLYRRVIEAAETQAPLRAKGNLQN